MAFAAWFGLLATALNLFPIAQLDGGHISYAVLGRRSLWVTLAMVVVAIGLTFLSSSWIAWTVMLVVMLVVVGPRHPPTLDDHTPLGSDSPVAGALRAGDADRLLHARADRAVRHGPVSSEHRRSGSTSTEARPRQVAAPAVQRGAQRLAHRGAARALEEELRAVLAAQPGQRRRRRPEHHEARRSPVLRTPTASSAPPAMASSNGLPRTTTLTIAMCGG